MRVECDRAVGRDWNDADAFDGLFDVDAPLQNLFASGDVGSQIDFILFRVILWRNQQLTGNVMKPDATKDNDSPICPPPPC